MQNFKTISHLEAYKKMQSGKPCVILDVREAWEYEDEHIKGAINIPFSVLMMTADKMLTNKEEDILIYCRTGSKSMTAGFILRDLGYQHLYDFGGIIGWPYDIVTN